MGRCIKNVWHWLTLLSLWERIQPKNATAAREFIRISFEGRTFFQPWVILASPAICWSGLCWRHHWHTFLSEVYVSVLAQLLPGYVYYMSARRPLQCAPQPVPPFQLVDSCIIGLLTTTLITPCAFREHYCNIVTFICEGDPNVLVIWPTTGKQFWWTGAHSVGLYWNWIGLRFYIDRIEASGIRNILIYQLMFLNISVGLSPSRALKIAVEGVIAKSNLYGLYFYLDVVTEVYHQVSSVLPLGNDMVSTWIITKEKSHMVRLVGLH